VQWFRSDAEFELGSNLLPPLLQVTKQCIEGHDEETVLKAIEMLIECVQFSFGTLERSLPMVVKFMLDVATSASTVERGTREQAMSFVTELATYKAKVLKKRNLVTMILNAIFVLCAEPDGDIDPEEDDATYTWAGATLDMLAVNLPSRQLVPSILHHISSTVGSPDKYQRRGAIYVMGTCAEGCSEFFSQELSTVLPWLMQGLADGEDVVRSTACWALTQFVEFLQPEIAEHCEDLLPGVFLALDDHSPAVQRPACHALEEMCDMLEERIAPYLDRLMAKMGQLLASDSNELRELGVSAVASAAGATGALFRPYYPAAMQAVARFMQLTDADDLLLRARATECGGVLVAALGREACQADLAGFVERALLGLRDPDLSECPELREYTYSAFANLAGVLGEDLAPAMPSLMPLLLQSCASEDGVLPMAAHGGGGMVGVGRDSDDDEDDDDPRTLVVRTAVMDEKASAVHTVGALAEGTGAAFAPYLDEALGAVQRLLGYFHEDVRQSVMGALGSLLLASLRLHTAPMRAGAGAVAEQMLHPHTALLLDSSMAEFLRVLREDEDKETVAVACEAIRAVAAGVGGFCMGKFLAPLVAVLLELFDGKVACQADDAEEDEAEAAEAADHDQARRRDKGTAIPTHRDKDRGQGNGETDRETQRHRVFGRRRCSSTRTCRALTWTEKQRWGQQRDRNTDRERNSERKRREQRKGRQR
jgi:importin-4